MLDNDQQLLAAATQYLAQLDRGDLISVEAFAATVDQPLRAELVAYLQEILEDGQPIEPIVLTPAEYALGERVTARTLARVANMLPVPVPLLAALRTDRNLSVQTLAQRLNLPVDLLARIERGGVAVNSLPAKLVMKLASALEQTEAQIRSALQISLIQPDGMQLRENTALYSTAQPAPQLVPSDAAHSSQDSSVPDDAQVVSFTDALEASMATAEQRAEWQRD